MMFKYLIPVLAAALIAGPAFAQSTPSSSSSSSASAPSSSSSTSSSKAKKHHKKKGSSSQQQLFLQLTPEVTVVRRSQGPAPGKEAGPF